MKRIRSAVSILAMVGCLWGLPAMAVEFSSGVDLNSAYVWRGMTINDGLVAQPNLNIANGGFNFNVWGNLDLSDYNGAVESGEISEVDMTASYDFVLGSIDTTVAYAEYLYPATEAGAMEGTREMYVSLSLPLSGGLSTTFDLYYDIDEVKEYYSKLGLSYEYGIGDSLTLTAGGSIGYAGDKYCADEGAGLFDYALLLSLDYGMTEALSFSARVNYVGALDSDNLPEGVGLMDVTTWGGVGLTYTF
jgi:hypothetical protein